MMILIWLILGGMIGALLVVLIGTAIGIVLGVHDVARARRRRARRA